MANFALSRFQVMEGAGKTFRRTPDFDAKTYARQAFGITRWELSWMPDMRMRAPKGRKDSIEEKLRDGLARQTGRKECLFSSSSG